MRTYTFIFLFCGTLMGCADSGKEASSGMPSDSALHNVVAVDSGMESYTKDSVIADTPMHAEMKKAAPAERSPKKVEPKVVVREMPHPGVSEQDKRYIDSVKAAKKRMK